MNASADFALTGTDAETILQWHAYSTSESYHRGGDTIMTSDEIILLNILKSPHDPITLTVSQLLMVHDWMMKSVKRRYGSSTVLLRQEQELYNRIEQEMTGINSEPD